VLVLSTLVSVLAPSYRILLAARVVTALAQAIFWAVMALATRTPVTPTSSPPNAANEPAFAVNANGDWGRPGPRTIVTEAA
jgi:hypothetical protein